MNTPQKKATPSSIFQILIHTCRRWGKQLFTAFLGLKRYDPVYQDMVLQAARRGLRRKVLWVYGGILCGLLIGIVFLHWSPTKWNPEDLIYSRLWFLDLLFLALGLVAAMVTCLRQSPTGIPLEDMDLCGLPPRIIAALRIAGPLAIFLLTLPILFASESLFIYLKILKSVHPVGWHWIRAVVIILLVVALISWSTAESFRLGFWGIASSLADSSTRNRKLEFGRMNTLIGPSLQLIIQTFLMIPLAMLTFFILSLVIYLLHTFDLTAWRMDARDIRENPELILPLYILPTLVLIVSKRILVRFTEWQFTQSWLCRQWLGLAEKSTTLPPHFDSAINMWIRYLQISDAIDQVKRKGKEAPPSLLRSIARYRWLYANQLTLDPDSHRTTGFCSLTRRVILPPEDSLSIPAPPIPIPTDMNPNRPPGSPANTPDRLQNESGSWVRSIPKQEATRIDRLSRIAAGICNPILTIWLLGLPAAVCYVLFLPKFHMSIGTLTTWMLIGGGAALGIAYLPGLLFLDGFRKTLIRRRIKRYVADRILIPKNAIFLLLCDARVFHAMSPSSTVNALLWKTDDGVKIAGTNLIAHLDPGEVRFQVHEQLLEPGVLVSIDFGPHRWAVTVREDALLHFGFWSSIGRGFAKNMMKKIQNHKAIFS